MEVVFITQSVVLLLKPAGWSGADVGGGDDDDGGGGGGSNDVYGGRGDGASIGVYMRRAR